MSTAPFIPSHLDEKNVNNLKLLTIFHYVWGGLTAVCGCFPVLHVLMGGAMLVSPPSGDAEAQAVGGVFVVVGLLTMLLIWAIAGLIIYAGKSIAQRKRWMFCLIVAGISCLSFPFGTALGVCTLIVLLKPEVKAAFGVPN